MADILSKEEKEEIVNRKMEAMRVKNEMIRRRKEEIEAEKKMLGHQAVSPNILETENWKAPEYRADWLGRDEERFEGRISSAHNSSWPITADNNVQSVQVKRSGNRQSGDGHQHGMDSTIHAHGRGDAKSSEPTLHRLQGDEDWEASPLTHSSSNSSPRHNVLLSPVKDSTSHRGGFGRGATREGFENVQQPRADHRGRSRPVGAGSGRLPGRSSFGDSKQDQSYEEKRKQNYQAFEEEMKANTADSASTFLADRSRDAPTDFSKTNSDLRGQGNVARRHPRNLGGENPDDLRDKIRGQRERRRAEDSPLELKMTGKERHHYQQWREEREQIDLQRLERAKASEGCWRREWDNTKQHPSSHPEEEVLAHLSIYKDTEEKRFGSTKGKTDLEQAGLRGVDIKGLGTGKARGRARPMMKTKVTEKLQTEGSLRVTVTHTNRTVDDVSRRPKPEALSPISPHGIHNTGFKTDRKGGERSTTAKSGGMQANEITRIEPRKDCAKGAGSQSQRSPAMNPRSEESLTVPKTKSSTPAATVVDRSPVGKGKDLKTKNVEQSNNSNHKKDVPVNLERTLTKPKQQTSAINKVSGEEQASENDDEDGWVDCDDDDDDYDDDNNDDDGNEGDFVEGAIGVTDEPAEKSSCERNVAGAANTLKDETEQSEPDYLTTPDGGRIEDWSLVPEDDMSLPILPVPKAKSEPPIPTDSLIVKKPIVSIDC